ncbi:hypothetical protein SAY87_014691 [Trapa incisa]|uniref:Uncharacterized protein n=1 Tax=Trapa incisa TaxID=236973 RepID=A0AAN7JLC1_9MYRT|nr:hypothetical protein SAY87_014691 [Trapa incisa]
MAGEDDTTAAGSASSVRNTGWTVPKPTVDLPSGSSEWSPSKPDFCWTLPAAEEADRHAVLEMHCRVFDSFSGLLERTASGDGHGGVAGDDRLKESKEYEFMFGVFLKDKELRDYYQRKCLSGEFYCLVCGGDKKCGNWENKFESCEGLLQHSISTTKTDRRKFHRALGLVICKVLGWDFNSLPVIVTKGEPLGRSFASVDDIQDSGPVNSPIIGWLCEDNKNVSKKQMLEWPKLNNFHSDLVNDSVSVEEKLKIAAEQKILTACRDFFRCKYGSKYGEDDGDLIDEEEDEDEEDEENEDENALVSGESEEFKFFVNLFEENANLRSYYEKSSGDGDFLCLVCAAVKKKTWRRFKGCSGLLHHSNSIWKFKKKAHMGYAKAVCKIFGWDIERLPRIVNISEPLSLPLAGTQDSAPLPASGAEWPRAGIVDPDSSKSGWPNLKLPSEPLSADEQEKLAADQKVLQACRKFFHDRYGSDLDEDDDIDEDSDDLTDEVDEAQDEDHYENKEEFKFFLKLFKDDERLRRYYVDNCGSGDFRCLVCAAVHKKDWKRFKGCVGLINHSNMVLETNRKAHRAYARAVCGILGLDVGQSSRIATVGEPLGRSRATSDGMQDEAKANSNTHESYEVTQEALHCKRC